MAQSSSSRPIKPREALHTAQRVLAQLIDGLEHDARRAHANHAADLLGGLLAQAFGRELFVDAPGEHLGKRAHHRHVALAEAEVGSVAEAAQRAVDLSVLEPHRNAQV
jgi:hypothetical protein